MCVAKEKRKTIYGIDGRGVMVGPNANLTGGGNPKARVKGISQAPKVDE